MTSGNHDTVPVVIDHGTFQMKAGFAGEDAPRAVVNSIVGRLRPNQPEDLIAKLNLRGTYVGEEAQQKRGILVLAYPMERGIITKWDAMEKIWTHTFAEELKVNPQDERILLSQTPNNPKPNKEKMAEVFFEKFQSRGICLANQAALALYSSGRTCGLIVDSGHGVSCAVPIHQGKTLPPTHMDLAGSDLTEAMYKHICKKGYAGRMSEIHDVKEKLCYVALDPDKNESQVATPPSGSSDQNTYEFPWDQKVTVDSSERYRIPEALFKPSIIGIDYVGIHEMAYNTMSELESDVRKDLLRLVYLVGGSTLFPGFKDRIELELSALAPPSTEVNVVAVPERKYSVWNGGSIFASRSHSESHWISKQEYEETGPDVVHRKYL